jgi:hypothetical protein
LQLAQRGVPFATAPTRFLVAQLGQARTVGIPSG